jgi:hypothetical protein
MIIMLMFYVLKCVLKYPMARRHLKLLTITVRALLTRIRRVLGRTHTRTDADLSDPQICLLHSQAVGAKVK